MIADILSVRSHTGFSQAATEIFALMQHMGCAELRGASWWMLMGEPVSTEVH